MAGGGLGDTQIKASERAKQKILAALSTGEYVRYKEIQEKTGLSTATLTKHLKELEKGIVERFEDSSSKEYPTPVYYKLNQSILNEKRYVERFRSPIDKMSFEDTKDISGYIEYLNVHMGLRLLSNVSLYFTKNKNEVAFEQALDNFYLIVYRECACLLKEKCEELSNKGVDIQLLLGEAEKEILWHYMKIARKEES